MTVTFESTGSTLSTGTVLAQQRRLATEVPGPRSRALTARRAQAVSAGISTALPVFIAQAAGGVLLDVDGNSLIDLGSGIAVTSVGNAAPPVVEAVRRQVSRFTHTCFMVTPYEEYVAVCEQLNALTPGDHPKRSALFNSGAEAVENAVKIARYVTGRQAVVVLDHAYHGRTNLTLALTAKNMPYKHRFGPLAPEVYRGPTSYPFRDPAGMTGEQAAARALNHIESQVGGENIAAVVIEPVQGEGGFIDPAPGFLPTVAGWCRANGAMFVADEIQTGFCRTGDWFACQHEDVVPDIVTTAKGIAGGLPLAGVTGRAELEVILERLRRLQRQCPGIGDVRGRGAMIAIEFVKPASLEPDPETTQQVARACHVAGVLLLTCGTFSNVIRLLPPLVIGDELLAEGLDVLERAITSVFA